MPVVPPTATCPLLLPNQACCQPHMLLLCASRRLIFWFGYVRDRLWLLHAAAVALRPVLSPLLLFCCCCTWQGPAAVPWGYSLIERDSALEPIITKQTSLLRAQKVQKWRRKRSLMNGPRRGETYAGKGYSSGAGGANYSSEITYIHMETTWSFLPGESA